MVRKCIFGLYKKGFWTIDSTRNVESLSFLLIEHQDTFPAVILTLSTLDVFATRSEDGIGNSGLLTF